MKSFAFLFGLALSVVLPSNAQDITNKLGAGGFYRINDATHTLVYVVQATGGLGVGVNPRSLFEVDKLIVFDPLTSSTAIGDEALVSNTQSGGANTAIGRHALHSNTTGSSNTAIGDQALGLNSTGSYNTASGLSALYRNLESFNTGIGYYALLNTTAAENNVAVGYGAGDTHNNGYNNVFVGANTDVNQNDLFNVVAVGEGTIVTASSTARFGNSSTGSYGGWANWSNVSDARFKKNVRENVPGLEFISKLRPVTYNFDATGMDAFLHRNDPHEHRTSVSPAAIKIHTKALLDKERISQTGFVAQEVERTARELGYDFSGVDKPKNKNDYYGLRYAEFVVPLVKAVQELNMKQESQIAQLKSENEALKSEVGTLYASQAGLTTENTDVKERLSQLEHLQELLVTQLARLQKQETAAASLAGN